MRAGYVQIVLRRIRLKGECHYRLQPGGPFGLQ
jgi:hypothetical protein